MVVVAGDLAARVPHVPELRVLVGMARRAGVGTDEEAERLVEAALQLLAEQWSDGLRIRMVAAAPVDVARWLVPPRRPSGRLRPDYRYDDLASALAEECGCPVPVARGILEALVRGLDEVLPTDARPAGAPT